MYFVSASYLFLFWTWQLLLPTIFANFPLILFPVPRSILSFYCFELSDFSTNSSGLNFLPPLGNIAARFCISFAPSLSVLRHSRLVLILFIRFFIQSSTPRKGFFRLAPSVFSTTGSSNFSQTLEIHPLNFRKKIDKYLRHACTSLLFLRT